jgi:hypothetical protein
MVVDRSVYQKGFTGYGANEHNSIEWNWNSQYTGADLGIFHPFTASRSLLRGSRWRIP